MSCEPFHRECFYVTGTHFFYFHSCGYNLQHERTSFSIIFCLYDVLSFTFLYLLINIIFPLLIISWKYRILSLERFLSVAARAPAIFSFISSFPWSGALITASLLIKTSSWALIFYSLSLSPSVPSYLQRNYFLIIISFTNTSNQYLPILSWDLRI